MNAPPYALLLRRHPHICDPPCPTPVVLVAADEWEFREREGEQLPGAWSGSGEYLSGNRMTGARPLLAAIRGTIVVRRNEVAVRSC